MILRIFSSVTFSLRHHQPSTKINRHTRGRYDGKSPWQLRVEVNVIL